MRSAPHFILIILLLLGGCYNQSLESDQINIASEKKVRILLGSNSSGRLDRFKGSYMDVVNGGSVKLSYAFGSEAAQTVEMQYDGWNWTTDLKLSVGTYNFRATAHNSAGTMIFDAAATKTHTIDMNTTDLALGIQLNPIMEDTGGTPIPVITQITKPAGYKPGEPLNLNFTVRGGSSDNLFFNIYLSQDNESESDFSNIIASNQLHSSQFNNVTSIGESKIYEGSMGVPIPPQLQGKVHVDFSVYSATLDTTTHAQFIVAGVSSVNTNGSVIFMPQAQFNMGVRESTAANTIVYVIDLIGNAGFEDNITFSYTDSVDSDFTHNPDPIDPMRPNRRSGELYRESMEAGTLKITFNSSGLNDSLSLVDDTLSVFYNFEIPSGETTLFNTVSSLESDYKAPEITSISMDSSDILIGESVTVHIQTNTSQESLMGYFYLNARPSEDNVHNDQQSNNYVSLNSHFSGGSIVDNFTIKSWQAPGEWLINNFQVSDGLGSYTYYRYQPDNSTTHYVRESSTHNRYNNSHSWTQEVSDLQIVSINVEGEYKPDVSSPEVISISLPDSYDPITQISSVAVGDNFTVLIESKDDISGICRGYLRARAASDNLAKYEYNSKNISDYWQVTDSYGNTSDPYMYGPMYHDPCGGTGANFPDDDYISIEHELTVESWNAPGDWVVENFRVNDRAGRYSYYYYRPGTSEEYYVRNYRKYDNATDSWNYINDEVTNLPVLRFNTTGEHIPDLSAPEITSILVADTVAIGDNLTVYIDASDNGSGVRGVSLDANAVEYQSGSNSWNYAYAARTDGTPTSGTISLAPAFSFGSSNHHYCCDSSYGYSTGEWIIRYIHTNDYSGTYSSYRYRPETSEEYYVRNYRKYDNITDSWNSVNDEVTTLPVIKFNVTSGN